jgi:assimilatory nitrate reductase catalytic subunit
MARLPASIPDLVAQFGPHLNRAPAGGWTTRGEPDRIVPTHCCFCGQQCGIQLKVKDERIVGFEPWEEFPFNKGKLCPKGVKRYMQDEHPDRLLTPLIRTEADGFRPTDWDTALDRTAREIQRIQATYGQDAFAVLTGASLTNEKAYLMGKFARVAVRTANIDYNGRLCMVSAAAASKKILGIDRSANPWSDIPKAKVILVAGANIAECAPITTDYLWQARENGAKLIVLDPRMTPIARTADLFIPVRSGGDIGVFYGMLHVMVQRGWINREFIAAHTTGWDAVEAIVERYTPEYAARIASVPASMIVRAAEMWGPAETSFLLHARGIEHHAKGVENCMAAINLVVATGRIGREGCGYAMITGQGNGQGAREQGQKCDQLPGARDLENPAHREYIAGVWGVEESTIPHTGLSAVPLLEAIHDGRIKGLLLLCFNPAVSLPDGDFVREALSRLEFFTVIDFFMSETARYADLVLPGSLMEEDEGTTTNVEGRVIHHRQVVQPPDGARQDWRIVCDLAKRLGAEDQFAYESTRDIFEELRIASKGGVADYAGITWERIDREMGVFWPCPSLDHPGTPRLYEGWQFGHPDGKAHFQPADWRPAAEEPDADYPIVLTTGRVVSQYLSGTQTRRIGALVDQYPQPQCEIHPRLAASLGIVDGDFVRVESRRGAVVVRAQVVKTIRPDTVFVPYHWPLDRSANNCTIRAIDPVSKIPEFKICAVRVSRASAPSDPIATLEPAAGGIR